MFKKLPKVEKKFAIFFKHKNLIQDEKWNKKMGGRSCFITSGAFGDTLQYSTVQYNTVMSKVQCTMGQKWVKRLKYFFCD